ncbi:D-alanyl-D-alanine carboxypeptidase/D-alanyl-D-alanine-endopeptidase [Marinobacter sp. X15-166B]|nr:D-alanyl-D-alanine carboxypeptidase/D-alanyl-D-alanine-endopeptidase [Marinobacter sp. X15-166B]
MYTGLVLLAPLTQAADAVDRNWSAAIREYAASSLDGADALALAAIPLNGPGIEQYINADQPMSPGSIMKLVTTYAALEILGPAHHWQTRFYTDGRLTGDTLEGNLYVRFGGDPKLTQEQLWSALGELRGMGVRTIRGNLILDGGYFRINAGQPAFKDNGDNPYAPFLVEPSAYLTNLNLIHFQVRSDQRGTQAWSTPALPGVVIDNRVSTAAPTVCPARTQFEWEPRFHDDGGVTMKVSGELPEGCRTTAYFSLLPHARYSAALIRSLLHDIGITLAGHDRTGTTPEDARLLISLSSPDLVTMVRDINKWSSNVMARQLLLTIGAENRKPGDDDDRLAGIRTIHEWLHARGINTSGLVIDNGAGLTRHGRITARQGAQILRLAWNSPYGADLMASLPLIAMDGTMARRLRNTGLDGLGRIKTGYLEHVRSIAGFTRDKTATTWAVVSIVNHAPAWNGAAVLDRVLYSLYYRPPVGRSLSQAEPRGQTVR